LIRVKRCVVSIVKVASLKSAISVDFPFFNVCFGFLSVKFVRH